MDTGTQCQYIVELLERSKKGEAVDLPPEYPNIGSLKSELNGLKGKVLNLESILTWCKCEAMADKKQRLLSAKADQSSGAKASPFANPIAVRGPSTMTRPLVGKPSSVPGGFTRSATVTSRNFPPPFPPRPSSAILGKRGADTSPLAVRRSSRIAHGSNADEPRRTSSSPPVARRTRVTQTATPSSNSNNGQVPSAAAVISPPTRSQPARGAKGQMANSSTSSNSGAQIPSAAAVISPPTRSQPARGAKGKTSTSPPSTTSAPNNRPAKKSKFIIKGDEEFQENAAE